MAWVELLESHAGSLDSNGRGTINRRFKCWNGVTVAAILQDPGSISNDDGEFLPIIGAVHPDYIDQSMVLDHYECSTESVTVIAVAVYSNVLDGGSLIPNPDKRIGTSFERRNVKIPFGAMKKLDIFKDQNPVVRWEVRDSPVIETFMRLTYRTIVPKKDPFDPNKPCWDGNAAEAIRAEIGNIHRFGFDGGPIRPWQFSGADPEDRNMEEAVTVTYSWVMDPGTAFFQMMHPDPLKYDPNAYFIIPLRDKPDGFGNLFVRPPFTTLAWVIETETYTPVWFVVEGSVKNDDGWKNLPGLLP